MEELKNKLAKYFSLTAEAMKKAKIKSTLNTAEKKAAEDLLNLSQCYYDDAKHFEKKGDIVNAYGAVCYAHAFLDAGARLGYFDVTDNKLFMVD
ncbi:MAG TPA: DUF357 domain-containing protein [Candidatus Nanoarchaeia archaeon]|nr:DUF357 domain-containing protein [Candidatus Nanoarchaeia archaeon]